MILYIKHIDIEGPETLGSYLENEGFESQTFNLYDGDALPQLSDKVEAVISLGGPMNVYEEDKYSYLSDENMFIQNILERKIPYLGLCLGSQLLAKACSAKVVRFPEEEIGFSTVKLLDADDDLFKGLKENILAYQWHGDMWELPEGATLLASSAICPHQAFRIGVNAYGLQFHVEITDKSIQEWCDAYVKDPKECARMKSEMLDVYKTRQKEFEATAQQIYKNFVDIIRA